MVTFVYNEMADSAAFYDSSNIWFEKQKEKVAKLIMVTFAKKKVAHSAPFSFFTNIQFGKQTEKVAKLYGEFAYGEMAARQTLQHSRTPLTFSLAKSKKKSQNL